MDTNTFAHRTLWWRLLLASLAVMVGVAAWVVMAPGPAVDGRTLLGFAAGAVAIASGYALAEDRR